MMDQSFESRPSQQEAVDSLVASPDPRQVESALGQERPWKAVRSYDFRKPDKLSKDQMRTLQLLHESFAKQAASSLSAHLRTTVQMNLVSMEQGVYGEYLDRLPAETLLHIIGMDPMPGNALLGIDLVAAMVAVDRLLGGPGVAPRGLRAPTEIELALIQTIVASLLKAMSAAWSKALELRLSIRDVALDPRGVQVALQGDPVVAVTFELRLFQCPGAITLCLPHVLLEPALPKLTAQSWFAGEGRNGDEVAGQLRESLETTNVEMSVELGGAWVTLLELTDLKEGDVIVLDRPSAKPLDLLIGSKPKFRCRPGTVGSQLAVQVVGRTDQPEVDMAQKGSQGSAPQQDDMPRTAG